MYKLDLFLLCGLCYRNYRSQCKHRSFEIALFLHNWDAYLLIHISYIEQQINIELSMGWCVRFTQYILWFSILDLPTEWILVPFVTLVTVPQLPWISVQFAQFKWYRRIVKLHKNHKYQTEIRNVIKLLTVMLIPASSAVCLSLRFDFKQFQTRRISMWVVWIHRFTLSVQLRPLL